MGGEGQGEVKTSQRQAEQGETEGEREEERLKWRHRGRGERARATVMYQELATLPTKGEGKSPGICEWFFLGPEVGNAGESPAGDILHLSRRMN